MYLEENSFIPVLTMTQTRPLEIPGNFTWVLVLGIVRLQLHGQG